MSRNPRGETVRAFVAVDLSAAARAAVAAAFAPYRSVTAVGWVAAENLHLTLKFLGEVAEKKIPHMEDSFAGVANTLSMFSARLGAPGVFPALGRPRVIWVDVLTDENELQELARQIDATAGRYGIRTERLGFQAHVTVGRVRRSDGLTPVMRFVQTGEPLIAPAWSVSSFRLIRSDLTPTGAHYTTLRRFDLRPR